MKTGRLSFKIFFSSLLILFLSEMIVFFLFKSTAIQYANNTALDYLDYRAQRVRDLVEKSIQGKSINEIKNDSLLPFILTEKTWPYGPGQSSTALPVELFIW